MNIKIINKYDQFNLGFRANKKHINSYIQN
jgi:hypothetical protein